MYNFNQKIYTGGLFDKFWVVGIQLRKSKLSMNAKLFVCGVFV